MDNFSCQIFIICFTLVVGVAFSHDYDGFQNKNIGNESPSLATLRFVAVVARHGSRVPMFTYPNDPYPYTDRRFWPEGHGELTNYGKTQMFGLGSSLRKRYSSFLPLTYYPNDTIAMYNPVGRDFTSMAVLLASLYPPVGNEIWNPNLLWQPTPAKIYNFDVCELIKTDECPAYRVEAMKAAAEYTLKMAKETKCLMKYVSNYTGQVLISALQLTKIADTLIMQNENGFKLPEWTESVFPKELEEIAVESWNTLYAGSDKILSFTAGPELEHLTGILSKKVNGTLEENSKMYVEVVHDCTLYALLSSMGSPLAYQIIKTSGHLIFELHQLYSSYIVQVRFYKNFADDNPVDVNIERCPSPCSIENFNIFVRKVAGEESWDEACKKAHIF